MLTYNQKEIENLQEQNKNIKAELDKLQNDVSSPSTADKGNKKKFPTWGIILIVLGILAIAGVAGYFILERKERPKLKKVKRKADQNG